eukprot:CAMPEP_0181464504 /NCGR_PEP_ID=MMETSP1110-20121109/35468_1 /TAXON_ID=174948 /ORGANISM="Symbiodinium sp., Strain CCMP421" /LENGTH=113 /DNA_ID=CAMNT_0023589243 /DNA_START=330 /DNA_END=668 /DNA_ORIENTATION=-
MPFASSPVLARLGPRANAFGCRSKLALSTSGRLASSRLVSTSDFRRSWSEAFKADWTSSSAFWMPTRCSQFTGGAQFSPRGRQGKERRALCCLSGAHVSYIFSACGSSRSMAG